MPEVLNKRTCLLSENQIYVGRPTKWGNPFKIGQKYKGKILSREDVILAHRHWLLYLPKGQKLLGDLDEIKGKDLVCWCAPRACHADILLKLANEDIDLSEHVLDEKVEVPEDSQKTKPWSEEIKFKHDS